MHWKPKYFGKHAAQKVLGVVPHGFIVQELVKRTTRYSRRFTDGDYVRERLRAKIARFNAAGVEPPRIVVEQGTGRLGLDLVLFHLAGAQRIFTYDTTPWLRGDLLRRNAALLAAATDVVKQWRGCDPARVDDRARCLKQNLGVAKATMLDRLGVTVRVTRSIDRSELGSQSVELFYSDSTLQFVEPRELAALIREARRFLKPSGRSVHAIDCSDCHARNDPRIPRLDYLAWSDPAWRLLTSKYLNYQNRLRMPQFVALFEREGFRASIVDPVADAEDVAYVRRCLAGHEHERLEGMSPEDVATNSFCLVGSLA